MKKWSLPVCELRVDTESNGTFYCRHTAVRAPDNHVTTHICQSCTFRLVPCEDPRPRISKVKVKSPPKLLRMGWNVVWAMAAFAADGGKTLSAELYRVRLSICDSCPSRNGDRCTECGCNLTFKARGRAFQCPMGKWPEGRRRF